MIETDGGEHVMEPTCEELRAQLDAYVDCEECEELADLVERGLLEGPDAATRALLARHVSSCSSCANVLDAERHLREALRRCYPHRAPEGLRSRILGRMVTSVTAVETVESGAQVRTHTVEVRQTHFYGE